MNTAYENDLLVRELRRMLNTYELFSQQQYTVICNVIRALGGTP